MVPKRGTVMSDNEDEIDINPRESSLQGTSERSRDLNSRRTKSPVHSPKSNRRTAPVDAPTHKTVYTNSDNAGDHFESFSEPLSDDSKTIKAFIRAALMGSRNGKLLKREFFIEAVPELKGKKFRELLGHVNDYLNNVFGQELCECELLDEVQLQPTPKTSDALTQTTTQTTSSESRSNVFVLRSKLCKEPEMSEEIRSEEPMFNFKEEASDMGLLSVVLAIILLNQRVVDEKLLINYLIKLELKEGPTNSVDFERLLNQFHHQGYLRKRRVGSTVEYRWGMRSFAETTTAKMTAFFSEIMRVPFTETLLSQVQRSAGDR